MDGERKMENVFFFFSIKKEQKKKLEINFSLFGGFEQ